MDEMPHFDNKFRPQSWTGTELRCSEKMMEIIITSNTKTFILSEKG